MNKKLLKRIKKTKAYKRVISGVVAAVMFFGALPMLEISEKLGELDFYSINASAAGHDESADDIKFLPDPHTGYVELTPNNFVDYSKRANEYHRAHQNDKIRINLEAGNVTSNVLLIDFMPLGTEKYPFKGSVTVDGLSGIVLNLEQPLFDYVYDSAQVLRSSDNAEVDHYPLDISRYYAQGRNSLKPLLANNVIHDSGSDPDPDSGEEAVVNKWDINICTPKIEDSPSATLRNFGGLIGKMWNNYTYSESGNDTIHSGAAKLELSVTMNTGEGDTENVSIQGDDNIGFACGTMETGTSLTLDFTSNRKIAEITTENGNAGGFVGKMEANSTFEYTCSSSPFDENTKIETKDSSKGFAGGIAGYSVGGNVVISENHTVNQTIIGVKGEGGLFGYYKPSSDVTIETNVCKIDGCSLQGTGGSGGLIGVLESDKNVTISVDGDIESKRAGTDTCNAYGGLIGLYRVDSKSHSLTVNGTTGKSVSADGASKAKVYGGGIGVIDGTVTANQTDGTSYVKFNGFTLGSAANASTLTFGGLVGNGDKAFIDAKNVTIKTSENYKGGGLVGSLAYGVLRMDGTIDLSGAKSAEPDKNDTTNIDETNKVGIIVGYRDDALIYAKPGWTLKRNMSGAAVDDIGSWGQVIRFDGSSLTAENQLFNVNETDHTVQIASPSSAYTTIGSVADFAKTALCFQIDASNNEYVSFANTNYKWDTINEASITLTADIDLSGTGITGLTRDNDIGSEDVKHTYTGTLSSSDGKTITLAIGEPYGKDGTIPITSHSKEGLGKQYRHNYVGLFGSVSAFTITNVNLAGNVYLNAKEDTMLAGAAAAEASGAFNANNMNVTTAFSHAGGAKLTLGGVLGEATNTISSIDINTVNVTANISGTASNTTDLYLGGVVGRINETSNNSNEWKFTNVNVSGSISNTWGVAYNRMGGIVAVVSHNANTTKSNRSIKLKNITVSGLSLSASKTGSGDTSKSTRAIGGFLGYEWRNVNVDFDNVVAQEKVEGEGNSAVTTHNTITLGNVESNYGDIGGLVYCGTGYWTVKDANDIQLKDLRISSGGKKSLGLLVNKAWYTTNNNDYKGSTSSALYLELQNKDAYKITKTGVTGISGFSVFDEIVAYSAYYNDNGSGTRLYAPAGDTENFYVLQNKAAVISIKTAAPNGLYMDKSGNTPSNSYTAQTAEGNTANPYTRYYYNLDVVRDSSKDNGKDAPKLMRWGLGHYAHESISEYFNDTMGNSIADGTYDMQGYSWYPVDVDSSVTVNGTFKLYNKEFELCEPKIVINPDANDPTEFQRTSLDKTQHYLLQNGLFRNVNSDAKLSVGEVKLQGNVGKTAYGSGALICGKVQGSANHKAVINVTGSIRLDRVYVHDMTGDEDEYAPLLINKVGDYTQLTISAYSKRDYNSRTKVETSYRKMMDSLSTYPGLLTDTENGVDCPKAGTSLIGNVDGSSTNGATGVSIEFTKMILDGRNKNLTVLDSEDSYAYDNKLNIKYGTERSIFTHATFLEKFRYEPGSFGKYNFTWDEDWKDFDPDSNVDAPHQVTYGKELGYTVSDTSTEYPGKERYYYGEPQEGETDKCFVNPVSLWDVTGEYAQHFREDFLPYVYTEYNEANKTHQIMVNQSSEGFSGCGTYNDPYTLEKDENFVALSQIFLENHTLTEISVPADKNGKAVDLTSSAATWHNSSYGHVTLKYYDNPTIDDGNGGTITCQSGYYSGTPTQNPSGGGKSGTFISKEYMEKYLAGAYYILSGDENEIEIKGSNFKGIGYATSDKNNYVPFRGVIVGNGKTIVNKTVYPLIANANGCVLKNISIKVASEKDIPVIGTSSAFKIMDNNNGTNAYGALIGKVHGGDNIIDNCLVDYSSFEKTISLTGTPQLAPVGGYVGVIVNGGVIFRNMDETAGDYNGTTRALSDSKLTASNAAPANAGSPSTSSDNLAWLYVNPIIGRVINGYAVTESGAYRPFEDGVREYGDGTKVYYTETKGTDGKITSSYNGTKANKIGVTLKNGTKHYSITDISKGLTQLDTYYGNKDNNIGVPNGQAFFVMSLIVNSGMRSNIIGYKQSYQVTRWADYTDVATNLTAVNTSVDDYKNYAKNDWLNKTTYSEQAGYLAKFYTTNVNKKDKISGTITLTDENSTYYLPDGYKGIGNMYYSTNDNAKMSVTNFNGNGATISQNSSYYYYYSKKNTNPISKANTTVADYQNSEFDSGYPHIGDIGFGLFNNQKGSTNSESKKYYNFTLTGNVICDCIDNKSGDHIPYLCDISSPDPSGGSGIDRVQMVSAGMLMGTSNAEQYLDSVAVKNINVKGVRNAGGLIGCVAGTKNTFYKTTYKNSLSLPSKEIKIHSGGSAGGMIGKSYNGMIDIDNNNATYSITEVVSDCDYRSGYDYNYGVGGFIGFCRTSTVLDAGNNKTSYVRIRNVIVGDKNAVEATTVKCNENSIGGIMAGGLIGMQNKATLFLDNCKVYNQSVTSPYIAGGLLGYIASTSDKTDIHPILKTVCNQSIITNTEVYSNSNAKAIVKCNGYTSYQENNPSKQAYYVAAGGFIGAVKHEMSNVLIQNSNIERYTIEANEIAGGVVGVYGQHPSSNGTDKDNRFDIENFKISDCSIKATNNTDGALSYAGGLAGIQYTSGSKQKYLHGYNILAKNLTFTGTNQGYICGWRRCNTVANTDTYCVIKLAGFSRQDDRTGGNNKMISDLVGSCPDASTPYGTNGYVIFADYNDNASKTSTQYPWFSNVNNTDLSETNNVETMRSIKTWTQNGTTYTAYDNNKDQAAAYTAAGYDETTGGVTYNYKNENYPFVTSSPSLKIDSSNILTSDGISKSGSSYTYDNSMFKKIRTDIAGNVRKAYSNVPAIDNVTMNYIKDHYSTSNMEFLTKDSNIAEFPLIVVDDSNSSNVTDLINGYLRTLTNTSYNFADSTTNKQVYNVQLRKMVYDSGEKRFNDQTGTDEKDLANLRIEGVGANSKFCMLPQYVDTGVTQQFTLVDVQFYDPSTVTGTGSTANITAAKVAYHLYVPVYTRKILRYNFYATLASNTNYYKDAYDNDTNNNFESKFLFENLGNPVTYAFEYQYFRTDEGKADNEWIEALNSGENVIVDGNFRKTITIEKKHTSDKFWPDVTKMVLVDSTKDGKSYYLDAPVAPASETASSRSINLVDFKDSSNNAWKPSCFNDLMQITVQEDSTDGTLVEASDASAATFYVNTASGKKYYRPFNSGSDGADVKKYKVTAVNVKPERYYLTFFTQNEKDNFYYYSLTSPAQFDHIQDGSGNDQIEDKNWRPNKINAKSYSYLIIGDIYEDNFATSDTSLTVWTPQSTKLISATNNTLKVTMLTTINLKDSTQRNTIATQMSQQKMKTQIYHAFLMTYGQKLSNMGDEIVGIVKNSQIVSSEFKLAPGVYSSNNFPDSAQNVTSPTIDTSSSSFIKLTSAENLLEYLWDSSNQYAVTIKAEFTLAYYDDLSRNAQFPTNDPNSPDPEIGAKVIGHSNISSSASGVDYSTTSQKKEHANRYYVAKTAAATLSYNMVENTEDTAEVKADGKYRSLGINAKTDSEGYIISNGEYDTHKLTTTSNYIEYTLTLSKKNSYVFPSENSPTAQGTPLKISDFLSDLKIYADNGDVIFDQNKILDDSFTLPTGVEFVSTGGESGTVYTVRVDKSLLKTRGAASDGVYVLPIRYKVKTGDGSGKWNDTYSNYKVTLTAQMYNPAKGNASLTRIQSSWAQDYLIYTNAKVETRVIR
ncbi:hypothetical protein [Ruminococcus sp. FC2018]|uniref:hypothetical protein n=1 Tax=Ruminococcus sp. FC2018 TaxID=1410617 RepID=UPI0004901508|nr:hypothetical protein [Ruminococcus sp. FC2018]